MNHHYKYMNGILQEVLDEMTRATIRERFSPDMLLVTSKQMHEIMEQYACHGNTIFGMEMLPDDSAPKMKAFKGALQ